MEDVLATQLLELSQLIRKARQQWLRERPDVPIGTVSILKLIDEIGTAADGGCHAKDLAERSGLDPSTVSRAVAAAVGQGLVERRVDNADRRASTLALTLDGRDLLAAASAWFGALIGRALSDWPVGDAERVSCDLGRLVAAFSAVLENTHPLEAAR